MNMRQLKRRHAARFIPSALFGSYKVSHHVPILHTMLAEAQHVIEHNAVEAAKVEFVCCKVKDDSVVDTFDTREEALALVNKHAKQKKAKLYVMNSATGEKVLFTEEEMVA